MRNSHRWIVAGACAAVVACGSSNNANQQLNDTLIVNGQAAGATQANQFVAETSGNDPATINGKIAGVVHSINQGEIAEAQFILSITTLGPIINFANAMISDHTAADQQLTMVVRDIGTGIIASSTSTALDAQTATEISALRGSSTPEFDYMQDAVMDHEAASVLVEQMEQMTTDPELSSFLTSFDQLVITHRQQASALLITF